MAFTYEAAGRVYLTKPGDPNWREGQRHTKLIMTKHVPDIKGLHEARRMDPAAVQQILTAVEDDDGEVESEKSLRLAVEILTSKKAVKIRKGLYSVLGRMIEQTDTYGGQAYGGGAAWSVEGTTDIFPNQRDAVAAALRMRDMPRWRLRLATEIAQDIEYWD